MAVLTVRFLSVPVCVSMRHRDTERGWWGRSQPSWLCIPLPSHHHFQSASFATFSSSPTTPDTPQASVFLQTTSKTTAASEVYPVWWFSQFDKEEKKSPSKYKGRLKHIAVPNGENWSVERPFKKMTSCKERKNEIEHLNMPCLWERGCILTEKVHLHSDGCLLLWMDVSVESLLHCPM